MKRIWTIIGVKDVPASVRWYQSLFGQPETAPAQFKQIATAYHRIKDETSRHQHELFHVESPGDSPLDVFLRHAQLSARMAPPGFEAMKSFLQYCSRL